MQNNTIENRLIKVKEAAKYLAICERKLWELEKNGEIPAVRFDRVVRWDVADLDKFISKCKGA